MEYIVTVLGAIASVLAIALDGPRFLRKLRDWTSTNSATSKAAAGRSAALESYITVLSTAPKPVELQASNIDVPGTLECELAEVLATLPSEYQGKVLFHPPSLTSQIVLPGIICPVLTVGLVLSAFNSWALWESLSQVVFAIFLGITSFRLSPLVVRAFRARMFFAARGLRYETRLVQRRQVAEKIERPVTREHN